jgi:dolichyl-phosphate mannosyltransferase polypeptide 3
MTKLVEWLTGLVVVAAVWLALLSGQFGDLEGKKSLVLYSPLLALITFGLYSVAVIVYRVATFNDCEEAAAELQKHISEAREDLRSKGFKFD